MTHRFRIPLILQIFIFLIPMNMYVIGGGIGSGIQWLFFRYYSTYVGDGFVILPREVGLVFSGLLSGRSAISTGVWTLAVAIIVLATILAIYAYLEERESSIRLSALLNIGAGTLLILATMLQYGIFLSGPAGSTIPVGTIVVFIVAVIQYRGMFGDYDNEE